LSNETEKEKKSKKKRWESMSAYKTRDSSHLIRGTKSGKTTIPKFLKNLVLNNEID
jgi:hypothetical protein